MSGKYYIGVSSTFHDPSVTILDEKGSVIFAESTERYLQNKRAMGCAADPMVWSDKLLKKYCDPQGEFHIATTWSKSYVNILKLINTFGLLNKVPEKGISRFFFNKVFKTMLPDHNLIWFLNKQMASNMQAGISLERNVRINFKNNKVYNHSYNHHLAHAASAAYSSPFNEAVCLVVDGVGEMGSISYFEYKNNELKQLGFHKGFESLGFFYMILTTLCGFNPVEGEEWKVMGLAPYGKLNKSYYTLLNSIMSVENCNIRFKNSPSLIEKVISDIEADLKSSDNSFERIADLAHTGQLLYSEYMFSLLEDLSKKTSSKNLVLAGGCALNSSFNGKIVQNSKFDTLYVPSAPGDDGTSAGAAFLTYLKVNPEIKMSSGFLSPYLGSTISDADILNFIKFSGYKKVHHYPGSVHLEGAKLLAEGKLIGWAQGRAEFGPRALGNRSILADPRSAEMKDKINSSVKFREEFRPFAPSILHEYGPEYFEYYEESPYMERTLKFKKEIIHKIPAVVHVDRTGRLQTVKKEWNEKYYLLIKSFQEITGVPLLLNTSFNVMGKPMIHSFDDAIVVFFHSGLDALIVNDYIIYK